MALKVREVLTPLLRADLERVCTKRGLRVSGTKDQLLTRLAHSYRRNLDAVVDELRREDLLLVAQGLSYRLEFPQGLSRLAVAALRKLLKSVFRRAWNCIALAGRRAAAAQGCDGSTSGRSRGRRRPPTG